MCARVPSGAYPSLPRSYSATHDAANHLASAHVSGNAGPSALENASSIQPNRAVALALRAASSPPPFDHARAPPHASVANHATVGACVIRRSPGLAGRLASRVFASSRASSLAPRRRLASSSASRPASSRRAPTRARAALARGRSSPSIPIARAPSPRTHTRGSRAATGLDRSIGWMESIGWFVRSIRSILLRRATSFARALRARRGAASTRFDARRDARCRAARAPRPPIRIRARVRRSRRAGRTRAVGRRVATDRAVGYAEKLSMRE